MDKLTDLTSQLDALSRGIDRTVELGKIMTEMAKAQTPAEFWELDKKFKDTQEIFNMEDKLNEIRNQGS